MEPLALRSCLGRVGTNEDNAPTQSPVTVAASPAAKDFMTPIRRPLPHIEWGQIEQGQVDYQRMFTMIKTKLVRERGIIL